MSSSFPNWANWKLPPKVRELLNLNDQHLVINAGRGSGKTYVLLYKLILKCFELYSERITNPQWRRASSYVNALVIMPNLNMFSDLKEKLKAVEEEFKACGIKYKLLKLRDNITLTIFPAGRVGGRDGIVIFLKGALSNGGGLRGQGADIVWVDECAYLFATNKKTPGTTVDQNEKALGFLLSDVYNIVFRQGYAGYLWLSSTPANNFFDNIAKAARDKNDQDGLVDTFWTGFTYFTMTTYDIDLTPQHRKALEALALGNPPRHAQENLAELHIINNHIYDSSNKYFDADNIDKCFVNEYTEPSIIAHYAAIDAAYQGTDKTVATVCDSLGQIIDMVIIDQNEPAYIGQMIVDLYNKYPNIKIAVDATGASRGISRSLPPYIAKRVSEISFMNNNKASMMSRLQEHIDQQTFKFIHPDVAVELEQTSTGIPYTNFDAEALYAPSDCFELAYQQLATFKSLVKIDGTKRAIYFYPGDYGDDIVDSLALLTQMYSPLKVPPQQKPAAKKPVTGYRF